MGKTDYWYTVTHLKGDTCESRGHAEVARQRENGSQPAHLMAIEVIRCKINAMESHSART